MVRNSLIAEHQESTPEAEKTCRHHWIIDAPDGTTSRGVCKLCGAVKEFYNAFPAYVGTWSRSTVRGGSAVRKSPGEDEYNAETGAHQTADDERERS